MRKISACFTAFLIFFISCLSSVFAHNDFLFPKVTESQTAQALEKIVPLRFLPNHPLYFVISTKEAITWIFQPSALEKAEFDLIVSGKRLKEAYSLTKNGDGKNASKSLSRYSKSQVRFGLQLVKARSQNQDTERLIGVSAGILEHHEVLLSAISKNWELQTDGYSFDQNLEKSVESLKKNVDLLDSIKPGIKDRFRELFEI